MYIHGYAASVIGDGDGIVVVDHDFYTVAKAGQSLVDRVVDDLIYQMMQTSGACGTDIHAGAAANALQTLQDLDLRRVIIAAVSWFF